MRTEHGYILIVDDDQMNRDMLSRRLHRAGNKVATASGGTEALQLIEKNKFDLVLLDIMMPEINGLEVLKLIRLEHSVMDLPVIMVTAKDQSDDMVEAFKLGASDYVTKPIDFPVVNARIQTQLNLKRLGQLKDEFISIASHDLKGPLNGIMGFASLVEDSITPGVVMTEEMFNFVSRIVKLSEVMQRIIVDFLDFQAMEDGQLRLMRSPVNINTVVQSVMENNMNYAKSKNITLQADLQEGIPIINADESRIMQVVENFVSNAVKFNKNVMVTIRTQYQANSIIVEVSDNGRGLTEEDMNKLFVKYARLSVKPTSGEKSSGLGLAICKKVIDMHGGEIGARNNPDNGIAFWFKLPATDTPRA